MARHLPEPPVLVVARQSHVNNAVPGLLEHLKDTGFGEALGAGLFAFKPGLCDVGGCAARVLFGGMKCVSRGVYAVAGQHRHLGRALRRCLQQNWRPLHHQDCTVSDDRYGTEGWPGLDRWTAVWTAQYEPAQVRCCPRPATSACLPDSPVTVAVRQNPRSAPLCRFGPKDRATAAF
jgi:hypothetical protein